MKLFSTALLAIAAAGVKIGDDYDPAPAPHGHQAHEYRTSLVKEPTTAYQFRPRSRLETETTLRTEPTNYTKRVPVTAWQKLFNYQEEDVASFINEPTYSKKKITVPRTEYDTELETKFRKGFETRYRNEPETLYRTEAEYKYKDVPKTIVETDYETQYRQVPKVVQETKTKQVPRTVFDTKTVTKFRPAKKTLYRAAERTIYKNEEEKHFRIEYETEYRTETVIEYKKETETKYRKERVLKYRTETVDRSKTVPTTIQETRERQVPVRKFDTGIDTHQLNVPFTRNFDMKAIRTHRNINEDGVAYDLNEWATDSVPMTTLEPYEINRQYRTPRTDYKTEHYTVDVESEREVNYTEEIQVPYHEYIDVPYQVEVEVPVEVTKRVPYKKEIKVPYTVTKRVPVTIQINEPYEIEIQEPYEAKIKVPRTVYDTVEYTEDKTIYVKEGFEVPIETEKEITVKQAYLEKNRVPYTVDRRVPYQHEIQIPYQVEKKVQRTEYDTTEFEIPKNNFKQVNEEKTLQTASYNPLTVVDTQNYTLHETRPITTHKHVLDYDLVKVPAFRTVPEIVHDKAIENHSHVLQHDHGEHDH